MSVVIPTYNHADLLPRAIESVLKQTVADLELVVVDDASKDDTASVVKAIDDERLRYLRHHENRGGSAARNTGIEHASGEYIAFLDADDQWVPRKLEVQLDCLAERSDEWVAVYCEQVSQRDGVTGGLRGAVSTLLSRLGFETPEPAAREGGEELIPEVLSMRLGPGGGATFLVRAETVEILGGFDPSFDRHQDVEFTVRLLKRGKLAYVDEDLVIQHNSPAPDPEIHRFTKMRFFTKFSEDVIRLEQSGVSIVGPHWYDLSKFYFREGKFRKGIQYLFGAEVRGTKQALAVIDAMATGLSRRLTFWR